MEAEADDAGTRLREIIAGLMERPPSPSRLKSKERLREDLGFDSILVVDLMVEVEARLGVFFDPLEDDLGEIFQTVESLERFVLRVARST